jgi:competence protein ComEC
MSTSSLDRFSFLCLIALAAGGCSPAEPLHPLGRTLELHFFEVGKGDAILIRDASGRAALYDGGRGDRSLLPLLRKAGVRSLELVIASHNHSDHVGGLAEVVQQYRPRYVMDNGLPLTTRRYERFMAAASAAGATLLEPTERSIRLGDATLHVLPPPGIPEWGQNDNSIGLIVELGRFRASLLGDSEQAQQGWWLEHHAALLDQVTVHKGSHHGSRKGDTPAMMRRLRPAVVVVGVERGGKYPHAEMSALYRRYASVLRTDEVGTVVVRADATGKYLVTSARRTRGDSGRQHADSAIPGDSVWVR